MIKMRENILKRRLLKPQINTKSQIHNIKQIPLQTNNNKHSIKYTKTSIYFLTSDIAICSC